MQKGTTVIHFLRMEELLGSMCGLKIKIKVIKDIKIEYHVILHNIRMNTSVITAN